MTTQESPPEGTVSQGANIVRSDTSVTLPRARANAGPPVRGRYMWAVTVLSCPRCGGMHQHRAGESSGLLSGRAVRCCPVTGERYRLAPVKRWREARRG